MNLFQAEVTNTWGRNRVTIRHIINATQGPTYCQKGFPNPTMSQGSLFIRNLRNAARTIPLFTHIQACLWSPSRKINSSNPSSGSCIVTKWRHIQMLQSLLNTEFIIHLLFCKQDSWKLQAKTLHIKTSIIHAGKGKQPVFRFRTKYGTQHIAKSSDKCLINNVISKYRAHQL